MAHELTANERAFMASHIRAWGDTAPASALAIFAIQLLKDYEFLRETHDRLLIVLSDLASVTEIDPV